MMMMNFTVCREPGVTPNTNTKHRHIAGFCPFEADMTTWHRVGVPPLDLTRLHLPGLTEAIAREESARTPRKTEEGDRGPEVSTGNLASTRTPKVRVCFAMTT